MTSLALSYCAASAPEQARRIEVEPGVDPARARPALATSSINSAVLGCSSPLTLSTNSGIGTPQVRWRETHQSGRLAIMLLMRCSPQTGIQSTCEIASSARFAQPRLIHADEPLRRGAEYHRGLVAPAMRIGVMVRLVLQAAGRARRRTSITCAFASNTCSPANSGVPGRKRPSPPTGLSTSKL